MKAPSGTALTEEFRQQELERGRRSFYYFLTAICGMTADDPDTGEPTLDQFHIDLCAFLEGSFTRAVVCCSRGTGKSVAVMLYALWRCLYIINFSVLTISNSSDNAKRLHFLPVIDLLTVSPRAEYIRWLFSHRIPAGMADTNSEQLVLVQTDPLAPPAITYAGMESKLEGKHPDLIILDDPEGADAEKNLNANESAMMTWERVRFLPKYPNRSQIVLVATPWGRRPIVWQLRDKYNWQSEKDNEASEVKFFWRPIEDANGKSIWPARFPVEVINSLRNDRLARSQCWLERDTGNLSLFDMDIVVSHAYRWLSGDKDEISYKGFRFDPDKIAEDGFIRPEEVGAIVRMKDLRFFIHMDPLHRTEATRRTSVTKTRPATAAITVIGVAPDWHAFLIDFWVGDIDLGGQAEQLFHYYRLYAPALVTFESIGAQVWLKSFVETQEAQNPNWARPKSMGLLGPSVSLPRFSRRLVEADKTTQSKEWLFRERLSPWLNHGALHVHLEQNIILKQLEGVLNETVACDLIDCLAQGPPVWQPGLRDLAGREFEERRAFVDGFVRRPGAGGRPLAGFQPPNWRGR